MNIEKGKKVLIEIKKILDKNKIPFFIAHGTSLGAIRGGGIIPHDNDLDLGVLYENFENRIEGLVGEFKIAGFKTVPKYWPFEKARAIVVFKDGIKTDIAGYMKKGNERFSHSTRLDYAAVYPAEMIEKTIIVKMYGYEWNSLSKDFLNFNYGKNWMKPNPKWDVKLSPAKRKNYINIDRGKSGS